MINLEEIKDPSFIKDLSIKELKELASEIRKFLIDNISKTGGHLSSNLGVVEITIAMYYVFDPEKDKFLFDVGHQSYVHKILTGRAKDFKSLRTIDGLSGYINRKESKYDVWESGHSSTTISAASGMIVAGKDDERVIAIIGDSSIMNGVALEGLNFLGQLKQKRPIIILNDNKMGISKSVGALTKALERIRGSKLYVFLKKIFNSITPTFLSRFYHQIKRGIKGFIQRDNIFEEMGFNYYGPYAGNNLKYCIKMMKKIKESKEPVVIHFTTKKGKGYAPSENDTVGDFHGVGPFDVETGIQYKKPNQVSYSKLVADFLCNKRKEEQFYVVTPAMKSGSKLEEFASLYPNDFFDVGIAEEHAADMAAGIALQNKKVVLLLYATFAQRAYDMLLNDIARQNLKVIIGIDRAGVVGEDGPTHQGIYDVAMMSAMPNMKIYMPKDDLETIGLFNYAFNHLDSPTVIRYPRASFNINEYDFKYECTPNWEQIKKGSKANVISFGPDVVRISNIDLDINVFNARSIKPIDLEALKAIFENGLPIFVVEQVVSSGTLYDKILNVKEEYDFKSKVYNISFSPDTIVTFGKIPDVLNRYGFSDDEIKEFIESKLK